MLACISHLLANPGAHEAFKQKKNDGATPLFRLVSCAPKENECYTRKLLEMIFRKFPNHVKNAGLADLCITRNKPILFAWFVTMGINPSNTNQAGKFIKQHLDKQEIVDAEKLLLNAGGGSAFSLSHMITTAFSSEAQSGISLRSLEDSSIDLQVRPEMALSLSSSRVEEPRQISSNGISIQSVRISTTNKLQIRFLQDALEQVCFSELEFPRKYLQLKNKVNDYFVLSAQPTGIPLTEASKDELSAISSASLTKLFLLALILDPEMDDASKYWLVKKEDGKTANYGLVRTEPYNAIGLLSNKTKASYISEIFNRPAFMNRELDTALYSK